MPLGAKCGTCATGLPKRMKGITGHSPHRKDGLLPMGGEKMARSQARRSGSAPICTSARSRNSAAMPGHKMWSALPYSRRAGAKRHPNLGSQGRCLRLAAESEKFPPAGGTATHWPIRRWRWPAALSCALARRHSAFRRFAPGPQFASLALDAAGHAGIFCRDLFAFGVARPVGPGPPQCGQHKRQDDPPPRKGRKRANFKKLQR